VLTGEDKRGATVTVNWKAGEPVHGTTGEYVRMAGTGGSYRACPLMRVLTSPESGALAIVVGRARVTVAIGSELGGFTTTVTLSLDEVWIRSYCDRRWRPQSPKTWWAEADHCERLLDALHDPGHNVDTSGADVIATTIAKGLAEGSRNAMSSIRDIRYELEADLTNGLDPTREDGSSPESIEVVLVNLIELRRVISRVRDFAREGVRSALAAHGTSSDAYHAYRVFRDPTRIVDDKRQLTKEQMLSLPWISTLDAGVRQCERLDEGLKDEVEVISGLLSASATIASARDAQAQGQFNAVAGAVAVGFGLPALILALYGIENDPAPFRDTVHGLVLFLTLAAALGLGVLVWRSVARPSHSVLRGVVATLAAAFVILVTTGALATWL
jgi:hypothetical protein